MNIDSFCEGERRRLNKLQSFLSLPNYFKKIGVACFVVSMIALFSIRYFVESPETIKLALKNVILISMLLIALAREKVEDELIEKLRGQAYTIAFICGVIYALVQPYVNYFVKVLLEPDKASYSQMGEFIVLWFMLCIYLCFFHGLKRVS